MSDNEEMALAPWDLFVVECVLDSYNKSQRDAVFLKFILLKNSACLLARSALTSLADSNVTSTTNTCCYVYSIKTPDDGQ